MRVPRISTAWVVLCGLAWGPQRSAAETRTLKDANGTAIRYEERGPADAAQCLLLLYGSSGTAMPFYADEAAFFARQGFHVLMPFYFDATRSTSATTANYRMWAEVVRRFAAECRTGAATRKVFAVGYSLGASVALAAGSEGQSLDGIAEWYGSLPDEFFYEMKSMPPLLILHGERDTNVPVANGQQLVKLCELKHLRCDHHFYAEEGHGFAGTALQDAHARTLAFFSSLR